MMDRSDLARVIFNMNFGTLVSVGASLASMIDPEVRPKIETPEDYSKSGLTAFSRMGSRAGLGSHAQRFNKPFTPGPQSLLAFSARNI